MFTILASIFFVFGPSCGGKSTLCKALMQQLDSSWTYLDRDQLIENNLYIEEKADAMIEERILSCHSQNKNLIIDAQIPWRAPKTENERYILVYAPLSELLARDAKRIALLQRPPQRAHYARLYVEQTFAEIFQAPIRLDFSYELVLDSSQCSIDTEIKETSRLLLHP